MRSTLYETLAFIMLLGSIFFFYQCVSFLADKNYVGGAAVLVIGVVIVRSGVELSKLAILIRREEG